MLCRSPKIYIDRRQAIRRVLCSCSRSRPSFTPQVKVLRERKQTVYEFQLFPEEDQRVHVNDDQIVEHLASIMNTYFSLGGKQIKVLKEDVLDDQNDIMSGNIIIRVQGYSMKFTKSCKE